MSSLELRPAEECRWDVVALGEIMLRLDPGDTRIATARSFRVCEGGGEYNVARGLKRCFGLRTAVVTALVDNPVGRLIEDLLLQGGVELAQLNWIADDGIGWAARNGLNFTERGFGVRAALGCSDRGHSAASQMRPSDVDWEQLFAQYGARWFHCGGVFAALSEATAETALHAVKAARRRGTIVSYDLNFRPSLWRASGSARSPIETNRKLVEHVDVVLGNEEDFSAGLGYQAEGADETMLNLSPDYYGRLLEHIMEENPQLKVVAATLRQARTASTNDWGAVCRTRSNFLVGPWMENLEIFDRVGGGDSFASGFFYGLLTGASLDRALAYGVAHGALAMTTPGDTSMATLGEVERLIRGEGARVAR